MAVTVNRWGENGPRPEPDHSLDPLFGDMSAHAEVLVDCTVEAAWALVSDIARIGEFSPECIGARWLSDEATVGGRFEGTNRAARGEDVLEWVRVCEVLEWDPPRRFAYFVGDRFDGTPASRWEFDVSAEPEGTRIRQAFSHYPDGLTGIRLPAEADPEKAASYIGARTTDLEAGMTQTLQRMKALLEDPANAER